MAWAIVLVACATLFVRMAPDDALGAVATLWSVPKAIVLLALGALLLGAMVLIRRVSPPSRLDVASGFICLVLGIVTVVLGIFSL